MTEPRRSSGRGASVGAISELSKDERLAELEARLAKLERAPSLRARGRGMIDRVMPPEASEHFRNAGREQLLGVRSIVDFWIARIDEADRRSAAHAHDRERIEIE
jgi:hypothetical protein